MMQFFNVFPVKIIKISNRTFCSFSNLTVQWIFSAMRMNVATMQQYASF